MTAMKQVAVLGGGPLGVAVAELLRRSGAPVRLWGDRHHPEPAPGVEVCKTVGETAEGAAVVFIALPATRLPEAAEALGEVARGDQIVVHASRGAVPEFRLPHRILRDATCLRKLGALGGPLHAAELTSGRPIAAVLGTRFDEVASAIQDLTRNTPVRVHRTRDLVGVEVAGVVSNVTAIAVGMAEALGFEETTQGLLLTRGLAEATRLGLAHGADARTFAGLAGIGDLIPRGSHAADPHHVLGRALAGDGDREAALKNGAELEGVTTAHEAARVAARLGLELPLVAAVDKVLSGAAKAAEALDSVLRLDLDLDRPVTGGR